MCGIVGILDARGGRVEGERVVGRMNEAAEERRRDVVSTRKRPVLGKSHNLQCVRDHQKEQQPFGK